MNWSFSILFSILLALICSFSAAQVLFVPKSTASETLRISQFDRSIRFTKPINNFPALDKKATSAGVSPREAFPSKMLKSGGLDYPVRNDTSAGSNRWCNVPSIPPLRVLSRKQYRVSSLYGVRCHPITGKRHLHNGIDFPQPAGTPVYATADGYVQHVGLKPDGLGLSVRIEHSSGYVTTYGHLSRYEVRPGQWIRRGQRIGRVGQTGTATGPHLHYIVQFRGRDVDPIRYCFLAVKPE